MLIDLFKIIVDENDGLVKEKMCVCYARVGFQLTYRFSVSWCSLNLKEKLSSFQVFQPLSSNGRKFSFIFSEVFFWITEELVQAGYFDDCDRQSHIAVMNSLKNYSNEQKSTEALDKVNRLLGKFAELLDEDVMYYEALSPLVFEVFKSSLNDHTTVNAQSVIHQLTEKSSFLESLDVLTDFGAKLFRNNFDKFITEIWKAMRDRQTSVAESSILRQIAVNFTYELQARILRSNHSTIELIGLVVGALVN